MVEAATNAQIKEIFERNERTVRSDRRKKTVGKAELWVTELDALLERIRTAEADKARLSKALRNLAHEMRFMLRANPKKEAGLYRQRLDEADAALSGSGSGWLADLREKWPIGAQFRIEHDGFVGTVRGYYERDDGYRGIVGQIDRKTSAVIVHVYGERWLIPAAPQQGGE